jgi:hypothetical protein
MESHKIPWFQSAATRYIYIIHYYGKSTFLISNSTYHFSFLISQSYPIDAKKTHSLIPFSGIAKLSLHLCWSTLEILAKGGVKDTAWS